MNGWHSLGGMYRIRVVSASVEMVISAVAAEIELFNLKSINEIQTECSVLRKDYNRLLDMLEKLGAESEILNKTGLYWGIKGFFGRPVLLLGLLLLLSLDLYIPTRVLFVEIKGNVTVPSGLIAEKAEQAGIRFGASRRTIRSEKIKNTLLSSIPQLQWVGVNTTGCVATITVQEGAEYPAQQSKTPNCIIADIDGVIQEITVTSGTALCKVGQAVKKGQLLISGYTDLGLLVRVNSAEAEILAKTQRQINAILPKKYIKRTEHILTDTKFSIIFGKNIIKLYNDSGISDTSCVKIYDIKQLTLPGGFRLPFSILKETRNYCDTQAATRDDETAWLEEYIRYYLQDQMISGRIELSDYICESTGDNYRMQGRFICTEMIGKKRLEEIVQNHE